MRAIAVTIGLALAIPAHAQPADDQHAREVALYDAGKAHFDIAEYTAAIAKWKEAYVLSSEPLLLFNIAQAYRLAGDCAQANRFYGNYLRVVPKPKNQTELDAATAKCHGVPPAIGDATVGAGSVATTPTTPTTGPATVPTAPAVDERAGAPNLRIAGYVLVGGGVIAGIAAGAFAMSARSDARVVGTQPPGSPWTPQLADTERDGIASERGARILGAVGALAVVVGGVLWWLGRERTTRVDVAVTPQHAEVALTCEF